MLIKDDQMVAKVLQSFNEGNVVLYVGRGGDKYLNEALYNLPWNCVITSNRDTGFGTGFSNDGRECRRRTQLEEFPSSPFLRNELNIFQIYGTVDNDENSYDDTINDRVRQKIKAKMADQMLARIFRKLDARSSLVFIGYNSDDLLEYPALELLISIQELAGVRIFFFSGRESESEDYLQLKNYLCNVDFAFWGSGDLLAIFEKDRTIYESGFDEIHRDDYLFFKNNQPVTIKKNVLLHSRNFLELLTEDTIYQVRPSGRLQQEKWFSNFLLLSSDSPQWYGYLPNSEFYIKRDFEDILTSATRNLLSPHKEILRRAQNTPIILQGDPGSSKSIVLAALAYRIYVEKKNPVIFIRNKDISFKSNSSPEFQELLNLLQTIENAGTTDPRILIIWDCSSYRDIEGDALSLTRMLENVGKRIVLVCSSYKLIDEIDKDINEDKDNQWYKYDPEEGIKKSSKDDSNIYYKEGCYFITSTRSMYGKEKSLLQQKIKTYAIAEASTIQRRWKQLEEENNNDIFYYLYQLIRVIRPNLEEGLTREQLLVRKYVTNQLDKIGGMALEEENTIGNILAEALRNAGVDLSENEKDALDETDEEESKEYNLDEFHICVALFSKFKLNAPYSLAAKMLYRKNDYHTYSSESRRIFDLITTAFPYIQYVLEDETGNFVLRFRNALEAALFLEKNNISPSRQIQIVCEMLDLYAEDYRLSDEIDIDVKNALKHLLLMLGPNTEYLPYKNRGSREYVEHQELLKEFQKITEKLFNLRTQLTIPDEDRSFSIIEITFAREYYGSLWDSLYGYDKKDAGNYKPWEVYPDAYNQNTYEDRLVKLQSASDLALESIEDLKQLLLKEDNYYAKSHLNDQINSLTVEISLCNDRIKSILGDYKEFCEIRNIKSEEINTIKPLNYAYQYQMLIRTINYSPLNGYAYNALFRAFEKEYEISSTPQKLKLLSEIRMIADDAITLDIRNRGMNGDDELSRRINKIVSYSGQQRITINSILSGNCSTDFLKLFQEMVNQNNASSLCFVAQSELDLAKLSGKDILDWQSKNEGEMILSPTQIETCKKIIDFLEDPQYKNCVSTNPYALYLLLRTAWMYYDKRPLDAGKEGQLTYLPIEGWRKINKICEDYLACAGFSVKPIVVLINALSIIQLNPDIPENYSIAYRMVDQLSKDAFISMPRMRVPFLICEKPGEQKKYSGTVSDNPKNYSGYIRVDQLPKRISEKQEGIRYYNRNLGINKTLSKGAIVPAFSIGIGYTGFSAYRLFTSGEEQ